MPHEIHARTERRGSENRGAARRFPNRIAEHRRARHIKIAALARLAGSSRSHLSRVEAGTRVPGAILLHDVARALGVLVDALYDRDWSWKRRANLIDKRLSQ